MRRLPSPPRLKFPVCNVPGDSLANEVWISASLKDEQAASVAYHEVTHALNPRMAEAQVDVETGYFDDWMEIPANRPNFDLIGR